MSGCQESKHDQNDAQAASPAIGTRRGRGGARPRRKRKVYPTRERLLELYDYDPDTGILRRRIDLPGPNGGVRYNAKSGMEVGCFDGNRLLASVDGAAYPVHRLIWIMFHGYNPENPIDHINRKPIDNRINNLREVSVQCNARNCKVRPISKTGINGVSWDNVRKKYRVQIKIDGKHKQLGRYDCVIEAAAARLAAEQCVNWSSCDYSTSAFSVITKYLEELS